MLIAHVSDIHITAGALASQPALGLHWALGRIRSLVPKPDCVVITGDLTDGGTSEEYAVLRPLLAKIEVPLHLIAGNHDNSPTLLREFPAFVAAAAAEPDRAYYVVDYPTTRLVCCDSSVPGEDHGELGEQQLDWLDETLGDDDRPTLVLVHHPPMRTGIAMMDRIGLRDADGFADVLQRHGHVVRVLTGHQHRVMLATVGGVPVTMAPSTCRQVNLDLRPDAPGGFVAEPPGILLHWSSDDVSRADRLGSGAKEHWVTHYLPTEHTGAPYDEFVI